MLLASAFHRYADKWQHAWRVGPGIDMAKKLELPAYLDFVAGKAEKIL